MKTLHKDSLFLFKQEYNRPLKFVGRIYRDELLDECGINNGNGYTLCEGYVPIESKDICELVSDERGDFFDIIESYKDELIYGNDDIKRKAILSELKIQTTEGRYLTIEDLGEAKLILTKDNCDGIVDTFDLDYFDEEERGVIDLRDDIYYFSTLERLRKDEAKEVYYAYLDEEEEFKENILIEAEWEYLKKEFNLSDC